jgi:cytidyltransferase-like protein
MQNTKVITIGVFDLFHVGHLRLLKKAAQFGDLFVAVVDDEAVAKVKGVGKPIQTLSERLSLIKELPFVTFAFSVKNFVIPSCYQDSLRTETWDSTYFDIFIRGEDQNHIDFSAANNKILVNIPRDSTTSTTDIIRRIKCQ